MSKKELIRKLKYWLKRRNGLILTNKQIEQIQEKEKMLQILREGNNTVEFGWAISINLWIFSTSDDSAESYVANNYDTLLLYNDIDEVEWSPNWQTI